MCVKDCLGMWSSLQSISNIFFNFEIEKWDNLLQTTILLFHIENIYLFKFSRFDTF